VGLKGPTPGEEPLGVNDTIKILSYAGDRDEVQSRLRLREFRPDPSLIREIGDIVEDVRRRGDKAVLEATERWDSVKVPSLLVSESEIEEAAESVPQDVVRALQEARNRLEAVNRLLLPAGTRLREIQPGISVGEKVCAIASAGLWVPCRKGPLASTMLMLSVPATVAGVKNIVAATPPLEDGGVDPTTLLAARIGGATQVVRGNGVALVAALTFGTESVPRVDAIYGPGPPALQIAMGYAALYGLRTGPPMGPSEAMIIADDTSDPQESAADLLNECEHGPDSSCVLLTDSPRLAEAVASSLSSQILLLPEPRRTYVRRSLSERGMIVLVSSMEEAAALTNAYAPEHLQIALEGERARSLLESIENAGEILLGQTTAFSAANYALGITAVLPTGGSAKRFSGITVRDFLKSSTLGKVDPKALPDVWGIVSALGKAEGFPAHVEAMRRKMAR